MATITRITTRRLLGVLGRPWAADVTGNHVIVVEVELSDGARGIGFSWTPAIAASSIEAMLRDELIPRALGADDDAAALWRRLWLAVHEAGGGGVTTIALAGIDLAVRDALARREHSTIAAQLGQVRDSVPAYGSGINLHYSTEELLAQCERFVAAGSGAVKIKIGRPDLADDLSRVRAVRELIGPAVALRVDANQRWTLEQATVAAEALAEFDIDWLEEPLRADDSLGYRELARRSPIPLAAGENLHTTYRFDEALDSGALSVIQPNVVRVGGVTPFLEIAALAQQYGVRLAPHLLPELVVPLALALPAVESVEVVEGALLCEQGLLTTGSPIVVSHGVATSVADAGFGVRFTEKSVDEPTIDSRTNSTERALS